MIQLPKLSDFKFSTPIAVRWKDIDQFGHVNNSVYLTYFEMARFFYCKDVNNWDWDLDQFIIAKAEVQYLRPIFFPCEVSVYLKVANIGVKSFDFQYAIGIPSAKGDIKLAASGLTTQVMYDLKTQKSIDIPERIRLQWEEFEGK